MHSIHVWTLGTGWRLVLEQLHFVQVGICMMEVSYSRRSNADLFFGEDQGISIGGDSID